VDKIDILLAQVRIEVVIAEVTFSDSSNSGLNTGAAVPTVVSVGTAPNGGTSITGITGAVAGASFGPLSTIVSSLGTTGTAAVSSINPLNFAANITSLGAISKTKIMQE